MTFLCRLPPQSCPNQTRPYRVQQREAIFVPSRRLRTNDENQMSNATRIFTPAAQQAQAERGSSKAYERRIAEGFPDHVTAELAKFIAEQDTAFIATAT